MTNDRPKSECEVCGARVPILRRRRCWGCYSRWVESRPVGLGATCIACNEQRRENLRSVELLRTWVPMCHNCAHRATQLDPMPATIDAIRDRLERDRRRKERRTGKPDGRVFPRERRGLDRRATGHVTDGDLRLIEDENLELVIELQEDDIVEESADETRILELLPTPPPIPRD